MGERALVPYIDYLPDDHVAALLADTSSHRACIACPFTPGTDAYHDQTTRRIAVECAEAGAPFWCHLTSAGPLPDDGHRHLCAGWRDSLATGSGDEHG